MDNELEDDAGYATLSAQITRRSISKILSKLRAQIQTGTSKSDFLHSKQFEDYNQHSREVLFDLAAGEPAGEDFPPNIILRSTPLKPGTQEIELSAIPAGIVLFTLIQHDKHAWLVTDMKGKCFTLKLII